MNSISAMTRLYIKNYRPKAKEELDWFRNQSTLTSAIKYAALAKDEEGKRYSHQRRFKHEVLIQAENILLHNLKLIEKSKNFDELFELTSKLIRYVKGIGPVYIYDTSLRIGAKLNLLPTKVYLHAGTKKGAKELGFDAKTESLEVLYLPKEFHKLEPYEIEDILCIFKDKFLNSSKTEVKCY